MKLEACIGREGGVREECSRGWGGERRRWRERVEEKNDGQAMGRVSQLAVQGENRGSMVTDSTTSLGEEGASRELAGDALGNKRGGKRGEGGEGEMLMVERQIEEGELASSRFVLREVAKRKVTSR